MRRVVLVGATGFTGGLVAREVVARGLPLCLTGRDPGRVERSARELVRETGASDVDTSVVDVTEPDDLARILSPGEVVASCAGPFTDLGPPVIRTAVEAGAHYLDTTGEQHFMMETVRRWDAPARERGVTVVNAMAFEYAPGDAACALAVERLEEETASLDVTYAWRGPSDGTSPGTRASVLRVLASPGLVYEEGGWREEPVGARLRRLRLSGSERTAIGFPAGEVVTAGRDPTVDRVRGWLVAGRTLAASTKLMGPVLPPVARALRPLLEPLVRRAGPKEPGTEAREASRFLIRAEARGPSGEGGVAVEVRGRDPYGLTAGLMADAAAVLLDRRNGPSPPAGVLRPSAVLPPRRILDEDPRLEVSVEGP